MGRLDEARRALFGANAPVRRLVAYRRVLEALDDIAPLVAALGPHRPRVLL